MSNKTKTGVLVKTYTKDGADAVDHNGALFVNFGTDSVTVNNWPIAPGASYSWSFNKDEVNSQPFEINFAGAPGTTQFLKATFLVYV